MTVDLGRETSYFLICGTIHGFLSPVEALLREGTSKRRKPDEALLPGKSPLYSIHHLIHTSLFTTYFRPDV